MQVQGCQLQAVGEGDASMMTVREMKSWHAAAVELGRKYVGGVRRPVLARCASL